MAMPICIPEPCYLESRLTSGAKANADCDRAQPEM